MSEFLPAVTLTLVHEGGYVNNPADKGHATKYGITQKDMPDMDIANLTEEQATDYYSTHYWQPWMNQIQCQDVCNKIFDMSVLLSPGTAVRLLQRALGFPYSGQTGIADTATVNAANVKGDSLLAAYKIVLQKHFQWIVAQNPSQQVFLQGWMNRINA